MTLIVLSVAVVALPATIGASDTFVDVPGTNVFHDDIAWLADADVTRGCNPPDNTLFCPGDDVSREQMAAFMRRLATNQVVDAATVEGNSAADLRTTITGVVAEDPIQIVYITATALAQVSLLAENGNVAFVNSSVQTTNLGRGGQFRTWMQTGEEECALDSNLGRPDDERLVPGSFVTSPANADELVHALSANVSLVMPVETDTLLTLCAWGNVAGHPAFDPVNLSVMQSHNGSALLIPGVAP